MSFRSRNPNFEFPYGTLRIVTKDSDYTLTAYDDGVLANGIITITLPSSIGIKGRLYLIKRIFAGGPTTIQTVLDQTIEGLASPFIIVSVGNAATLLSDGNNWWII